jgi:hypothetical protein
MTQKEQSIIIGIIEDLTVWEARAREWRGELTAILQTEGKPPRRRSAKQSAEDKIREGIIRRYANRMARQAKQF